MSQSNEASLPLHAAVAHPRERLLFGAAVLVLVLALWSIPRLSFADGAVHVAMAHLLTVLGTGAAPALDTYFQLNFQAEPNWFIYPILAGLLQLFEPHTAEKVLLTGYVVGLPYAFRYAMTSVHPENAPLSWYALPFVFSWPLNLGLYNFILSLPLLFWALGLVMRQWSDVTPARAAGIAALALLTYFAHITSAVVLGLVLGTLAGWLLWYRYAVRDEVKPALTQGERVHAVRFAVSMGLAILPVVLLTLWFLLRHAGQPVEYGPDPWYRTKMMLYGNVILSHTRWEGLLSTPVALLPLIGGAAVMWRRRAKRRLLGLDGLLLATLVLMAFMYAIPNNTSGGGLAVQRIQIYPYLIAMAWLTAVSNWNALRRGVMAVSAVAAAGLLAINVVHNHDNARYVAEFESVQPLLKKGETVLLLDYAGWFQSPDGTQDSFRLNFIGHPQSRFILDPGVVDLNLYQASTPNFPAMYRFDHDPYVHLRATGPDPTPPPHDEFLHASDRSAIRVDAVLVWGLTPERAADPQAKPTLDQLAEGYRLVHTSEHGWLKLYRRKE